MGAASSGEAVRNAVGETPHNGGIGQLRRGSGGSPKKGSYSVRGGGGDFDDLKKEGADDVDDPFSELFDMAGARRSKVKKHGSQLVGALAARQKIINRARRMRERKKSQLQLTVVDRVNGEDSGAGAQDLGSLHGGDEFEGFLDGDGMATASSPKHRSPPLSPLLGYGRTKKKKSLSAKRQQIKLKRIQNKGKGDYDGLTPQVERVFTELKFGSNRLKHKRRKEASDEPDRLPMRPLAPIMAYSTSSSIVVRWADSPSDIARIELYELQWAKVSTMLHWETLAAVRHLAKSATIGNLPCYCDPIKFRVRAKSSVGWGGWSPISAAMQTSPNRPARPSQIKAGIVTSKSIEVLWPVPDSNGSGILYYTLYGCPSGGTFIKLYQGKANKYVLGSKAKKSKSKPERGGSGAEDDVEFMGVKPGKRYVVKVIATNKVGDSVSSEIMSFTSLEGGKEGSAASTGGMEDEAKASSGVMAEGIMNSWLHRARNANAHGDGEGRAGAGGSGTSSSASRVRDSSWETKWQADMPTGPTRIAQLANGWVECWDPASERIYYHNPRTDHTQWEYPQETMHGRADAAINRRAQPEAKRARGGPALPDKGAPFRQKRFRFLWHVRGTPKGACKMLPVEVSRDNLVYKSYQALAHIDSATFRRKLRITYDGEVGIDSGGITKDWFLEMSRALMDPRYVLFKVNSSNGCYNIDPRSGVNEQHIGYFRFFGRLLGKAIFDRHLIDIHFSRIFYKHLLGASPSMDDLKEKDNVYWESLQWVLNNSIDGLDLLENFSVMRQEFGKQVETELIPGGKDTPVTDKNKELYVEKLVEWECGGAIKRQMNAVRQGFFDLIPENTIKVFTVEELELLLNGKEDIDVDEMKACSVYNGGYDLESGPCVFFWEAMQSWDTETRGLILRFITGTSKVPLDGFDPVFTITKASEGGSLALPSSHTCFNQLVLPPYESVNILKEKMVFAASESKGFHLT